MKVIAAAACLFLAGTVAAQTGNSPGQTAATQQQNQQQKTPAASAPAPQATTTTQSATGSPPTVDPAKEADIRRLLDVAGETALITQSMEENAKNIKPLVMNALPPGDYREKLIDLFMGKLLTNLDPHRLLDLAIPIYDKYLSDDDIKALTAFYATPLGQKTLTILPKMMAELGEAGKKMGEDAGRQSMLEVLAEHPELKQALEDAAKKPR